MSGQQSIVLFQVPVTGLPRTGLRSFARQLQLQVTGQRGFTCLITDDSELQRLNREFLRKNQPTDVLSFPAGGMAGIAGEIAISIDRARKQAGELGHGLDEEIKILMLHGVLHLLGMDHEKDGGEMARAERKWRKYFGLPLGLIERAGRGARRQKVLA